MQNQTRRYQQHYSNIFWINQWEGFFGINWPIRGQDTVISETLKVAFYPMVPVLLSNCRTFNIALHHSTSNIVASALLCSVNCQLWQAQIYKKKIDILFYNGLWQHLANDIDTYFDSNIQYVTVSILILETIFAQKVDDIFKDKTSRKLKQHCWYLISNKYFSWCIYFLVGRQTLTYNIILRGFLLFQSFFEMDFPIKLKDNKVIKAEQFPDPHMPHAPSG